MTIAITDLVPAWELKQDLIRKVDSNSKKAVFDLASRELCYPPERLVCRPLLSSDLGLRRWITPKLVEGSYINWVETITGDSSYIGITKITQLSKRPNIGEIQIEIGRAVKGIFQFHSLYSIVPMLVRLGEVLKENGNLEERFKLPEFLRIEGYFFPTTYICPQNTLIRIMLKADISSTKGYRLVLGGFVVEPRGKKILP